MRKACLIVMCFLFPNKPMACEILNRAGFSRPVKPPVSGTDVRLTARFGMHLHPLLQEMRMNTGVDWSAPIGTPVRAVQPGRIVAVGRRGQYGNIVIVDHGGGWQTLYGHLLSSDAQRRACFGPASAGSSGTRSEARQSVAASQPSAAPADSLQIGDCVERDEIVGKVGSTGLVTGPAVHLELLQFGWPVDPLSTGGR